MRLKRVSWLVAEWKLLVQSSVLASLTDWQLLLHHRVVVKVILYKNSMNSLKSFHDGFAEIRFTASELYKLVIVLSVWLLV